MGEMGGFLGDGIFTLWVFMKSLPGFLCERAGMADVETVLLLETAVGPFLFPTAQLFL